jgi:DNA-binding LacI/PurR family transcriptional regulator
VAFSDSPLLEAFVPGIICIHQPEEMVAQNSFNLLMRHIKNKKSYNYDKITIAAKIVLSNNDSF